MRIKPFALDGIILVALLLAGQSSLCGDEKPALLKPTIHFKGFVAGENTSKTKITLTIEVEGSDHKYSKEIGCAGTQDPETLVVVFDYSLSRYPGWKFNSDYKKGTIVIEGWTDPKTNKFHTVKSIKFESKDVPKEFWPIIKMPPNL